MSAAIEIKGIDVFRKIVEDKQFAVVIDGPDGPVLTETEWASDDEVSNQEGTIVDMQTANLICQVYDYLDDDRRAIFMSKKVGTISHIAWKAVSR